MRSALHVPISIDTTKSGVARQALQHGAHIINDASCFRDDPRMISVIKTFGAGVIIMHRRGTPKTMQSMAEYGDVVTDVIQELRCTVEAAHTGGVTNEQIVIDPGIGFAKTAQQSLEIIHRIDEFKCFDRPILIGPSRKSFIGEITKLKPDQRLHGTVAACVLAYERGASVFRVHDAWATKEALLISEAVLKQTTDLRSTASILGFGPPGT